MSELLIVGALVLAFSVLAYTIVERLVTGDPRSSFFNWRTSSPDDPPEDDDRGG